MDPRKTICKNRLNRQLLLIFFSSLTFVILTSFIGSLGQSAYADFNFGAAGDWGCSSNAEATVANIDNKDPEVAFGLGDYSYTSTGSCWFNDIAPIDNIMKIAIGNHEDDSDEGFSGYMSHFGLSQTYYSYNHDNAHILVMDTDKNSFSSGSSQYNFIVNDLQSASQNPNIDWIIVYLHKPFYTSPNSCSSSGCTNGGSTATSLRNTYHPLFDQYGVDLVLQGHVHNYQRTFTLEYDPGSPSSPTITSNNANTYTEGNGAVFSIVGTGGINFHPLSNKASFVSSQQDDFFGQLDIKITDNGNKLEGKFYRNGNNAVLDSFSIAKAGNSPPVANNQVVNVIKNTPTQITLTATDPNNDPLTYTAGTPEQGGSLNPAGGPGPATRTYTPPNPNYLGADSFTFTANDGTVNSNVATVSINVIEQPQGGYHYAPSLVLTGSNYNDTPNAGNLQLNQFSVAAWFKTSTNFGSDSFIVNKGGVGSDSAGQNLNYGIWMNSAEQIKAGFETSSGADQYVTSVNTYNDGQWHYAVVTNDGSTVRLYIDGVPVAAKSTSGASPENTGTKPVRVGANSRVTPPTNFFTGDVDEVRVWNNDLTAQQVADAFVGNVNTAGQVLYLPFGSNGAPVANNQAVTVNKNTQQAIILTATDPTNDPLTYTVLTQPTNGILSGTAPNLAYNPNPDYTGPDSFTFKANDGTVDSNTATVSINVQDLGPCTDNLPISSVTASGNEVGNVPSNVLDGSLSTRWASNGIGQFISADLGSINNICSVDIAWFNGNARQYHFVIATSTDGTTFTTKFSGDSSGTTLNSEKYVFSATDARYVRVTVNGNSQNNWASITELDIFGSSSPSATSLYNYGPSLTLSGPTS